MITQDQKQIIINRLSPLKPHRIGIFGSYARNENTADSDLDILVSLDYSLRPSLLDIIGIEQELTDVLGIHVEVVTEKAIHPDLRSHIEKDLTIIFE